MQYANLDVPDIMKNEFYCNHVELSKNAAVEICKATINQCNDTWKEERRKRITGSNCRAIRTYCKNKNADWEGKTARTFFSSFRGNSCTKYGIMNERNAKKIYEEKYPQFKVTEVGLVIRPETPWLGFSPDGVVWPSHLIEVKCPVIGQNVTAIEAAMQMSCLNIDENGNMYFNENHMYFDQIQLGMYILGLKECHFIVYSSFENDIQVFSLEFKEEYVTNMLVALKEAYFVHLLPYISKMLDKDS